MAADWLLRWDRYRGEVEPAHLEAIAAGLTAMGWAGGGGVSLPPGVGMDVSMTYAAAVALGTRPALPAGARLRIYGGSSADPSPGWMIAGDYRQYGSGGGGTTPDTFTDLFEEVF